MEKIILAYTTAPEWTVAETLAQELIEDGLIACANLFPQMTSLYRWKGQVEKSHEVAMILKTTDSLWEPLCRAIRSKHPYETPCLIQIQADQTLPEYQSWLLKQIPCQTTGP